MPFSCLLFSLNKKEKKENYTYDACEVYDTSLSQPFSLYSFLNQRMRPVTRQLHYPCHSLLPANWSHLWPTSSSSCHGPVISLISQQCPLDPWGRHSPEDITLGHIFLGWRWLYWDYAGIYKVCCFHKFIRWYIQAVDILLISPWVICMVHLHFSKQNHVRWTCVGVISVLHIRRTWEISLV